MPSLRGGTIAKVFAMVDGLCAIQIGFYSDPPLGGVLYAGGSYSEGGSYMLVDTVMIAF
jgi:hypothetical protein